MGCTLKVVPREVWCFGEVLLQSPLGDIGPQVLWPSGLMQAVSFRLSCAGLSINLCSKSFPECSTLKFPGGLDIAVISKARGFLSRSGWP